MNEINHYPSDDSGDDDGTAVDLQAQEDLALALIRGK